MRAVFSFVLIVLTTLLNAQSDVKQIKSINPDSIDFSDLAFLKDVLKDVNIVALGEQMHYDGATFDAKVRLIKFLHKELGFSVIAFESGLYDCIKADESIKNRKTGDSLNYLNRAIFSIWNSKEVHQLASYIDETNKSSNPLKLSGFDIQSSGYFSRDSLINEFKDFINYLEKTTGKKTNLDTASLFNGMRALEKYSTYFKKLSHEDTLAISSSINNLLYTIDEFQLNEDYTKYWKRLFINFQAEYRKKYLKNYADSDLRDSLMADNIKWLLNEKYKNEKIILWAANTHIANSTRSVKDKFHKLDLPMGKHLKREFGDKYFSLVFTSYEGRFFDSWFLNALATSKPKKKSIESFLFQFGYDYAFLNLRNQEEQNNPHFTNSKFFGNVRNKMNVYDIADGVFYIRAMYPATYRY